MHLNKIFFVCIISIYSFSQNYFLESGINLTTYDFETHGNIKNENLEQGAGFFLKLGASDLIFKPSSIISKSGIIHSIGLSIQRFNSTGGNGTATLNNGTDGNDSYQWNTTFMGLFNDFSYPIYENKTTLLLNVGLDHAFLLDGKQSISNEIYSLTQSNEFKGVWQVVKLGLSFRIGEIADKAIEFGCNYLLTNNLSRLGNQDQRLSFSSLQISFKLIN